MIQLLHVTPKTVGKFIGLGSTRKVDRFDQFVVKTMERIKRFNSVGITNDDMHDHRVHNLYDEIVDEFIKRIVEIEED